MRGLFAGSGPVEALKALGAAGTFLTRSGGGAENRGGWNSRCVAVGGIDESTITENQLSDAMIGVAPLRDSPLLRHSAFQTD